MPLIHVVDPDVRRRAAVAHTIATANFHGEIYEDPDELLEFAPGKGVVLASAECRDFFLDAMLSDKFTLPVAFYGSELRTNEITSAMRAGALDFLEWPLMGSEFIGSLRRLLAEAEELSRKSEITRQAKELVAALSFRESQVLQAVALGGSNKSIADDLGISSKTVEIHRSNMMRKLRANSAADATRIAIYSGLDSDRGLSRN